MELILAALIGGPALAGVNHLLGRATRREQGEIADIVRGTGHGNISAVSDQTLALALATRRQVGDIQDQVLELARWQGQHDLEHARSRS